jgi:hypothetical protein
VVFLALLLLSTSAWPPLSSGGDPDNRVAGAAGEQQAAALQARRRVYAPLFSETIEWEEAGIFWFGQVGPPGGPGLNSADVRVAYTAQELVIYFNIQDYYIWYDTEATSTSDLTQYEAVAIYLDTAHDRATAPQSDDYIFLSGLCLYGCGDGSNYRREARGTGTGWDFDWQRDWTDGTWASWWCSPGPNSNECAIDFGWWSYIHVPWFALGLSGPPAQGTTWGLGVRLYDRDAQPPAGSVAPQYWPETFDAGNPSAWGELAFGLANYTPQSALQQGTTVIRRGLSDSLVEDAWVGGGGSCDGGHEGDPEHDNYGGHSDLYVANQSKISDFTCYSKSFMRFHLDDIPPGKTIISATLSLHHWGNADPEEAQPSLIWLFTVDGDWEEYTLTWNNAPLARENLTATWVDVLPSFPGWPGVRYDWDATQAVAEVYVANEPLNVALYTADTNMHSSKYLKSSDTGDWNEEARPTLKVAWGEPLAAVQKSASAGTPAGGEVVTYTLALLGNGQALTLTDDLPPQVSAPGSIQVLPGGAAADYDSGAHRLTWIDSLSVGQPVTITFPVTVEVAGPLAVFNTAVLTTSDGFVSTDTALIIVDACKVYLPMVMRKW